MTRGGAVEIGDSGHYFETLKINALAAARVEWRAANRTRPTVTLGAELTITGENAAEVTLSGLIISGGTLHVVETAGHRGCNACGSCIARSFRASHWRRTAPRCNRPRPA